MHHFRGTLLEGEQIRLDPANVYIQFHHPKATGPVEGWNGYLVVAPETDVSPGASYTLKLMDGRAGALRVQRLEPDDTGKLRAYFIGDGLLE